MVVALLLLFALTWPRAIAIGLGEESGDEVSDEIYIANQNHKVNMSSRAIPDAKRLPVESGSPA